MFSKVLNSVKDLNYVKITKENWKKIEDLFERKEKTIQEQETIIKSQAERLTKYEKYKRNDDLVYIYEQMVDKYKKENSQLKEELEKLSNSISKMDKKVQSVLSLESAYIQRIVQAESKPTYICPDYKEVGNSLVEYYA